MKTIIPDKLKKGDMVRVIAPSDSLAAVPSDVQKVAFKRITDMGLKVTFGKHVNEIDEFDSSGVQSRVEDFHDALRDSEVKAIFAVIGGFNCNQILDYIDWDLIRDNPKIIIGYSDTTALQNAIYTKTGLVTYSGPAFMTFGQKNYFDYTLEYVKKMLFEEGDISIESSEWWSDDATWYKHQDERNIEDNKGLIVINEGVAEGAILGANISTFSLLQGTEYFPSLSGSILFLEDDTDLLIWHFDRLLQSLIHQKNFHKVKGIVIGRFQKKSNISIEFIKKIIRDKKELANMPVIMNADFGHTFPMFTFPIGGSAEITASNEKGGKIKILQER